MAIAWSASIEDTVQLIMHQVCGHYEGGFLRLGPGAAPVHGDTASEAIPLRLRRGHGLPQ
jgi:hypothetical protein